jgi:hypothetical protein
MIRDGRIRPLARSSAPDTWETQIRHNADIGGADTQPLHSFFTIQHTKGSAI